MKFLLVALNAKYIHSNPALYSLRAYVGEELQKHVEIAEYTINHAFTDVLSDIYILQYPQICRRNYFGILCMAGKEWTCSF